MDYNSGENITTVDSILEQVRSAQIQQNTLKKRFGKYRAKDVDPFIKKLYDHISDMEDIFQNKYTEMRTSLLGMTRQRDELQSRVRDMEQELKDAPERYAKYLKEQGYVPVLQPELKRLKSIEAVSLQEIERIKKENNLLMRERNDLKGELAQVQSEKTALLQEEDNQNRQLTQSQRRVPLRLEITDSQRRAQENELNQIRAQIQSLEVQYRLAQEMTQRLLQEKERLEKELAAQKDRLGDEKAAITRHYQGILRAQQQILHRLYESFTDSVKCIGSLNKTEYSDNSDGEIQSKRAAE